MKKIILGASLTALAAISTFAYAQKVEKSALAPLEQAEDTTPPTRLKCDMGGIERDGPNTKACAVYYKDALIGFTIQGTGKDGQSEMDIMWLKSNIKTSLDQMQKEAELKAQEEAEALRDVKAAEEAESEENDKAEEADEDKSSEEDTKAE